VECYHYEERPFHLVERNHTRTKQRPNTYRHSVDLHGLMDINDTVVHNQAGDGEDRGQSSLLDRCGGACCGVQTDGENEEGSMPPSPFVTRGSLAEESGMVHGASLSGLYVCFLSRV
jgi:hypothetical protein